MSSILVESKKKARINLNQIQDIFFFLYLLATSAHQTGEGFDAIFIRV